jgi:hypothetical protein
LFPCAIVMTSRSTASFHDSPIVLFFCEELLAVWLLSLLLYDTLSRSTAALEISFASIAFFHITLISLVWISLQVIKTTLSVSQVMYDLWIWIFEKQYLFSSL